MGNTSIGNGWRAHGRKGRGGKAICTGQRKTGNGEGKSGEGTEERVEGRIEMRHWRNQFSVSLSFFPRSFAPLPPSFFIVLSDPIPFSPSPPFLLAVHEYALLLPLPHSFLRCFLSHSPFPWCIIPRSTCRRSLFPFPFFRFPFFLFPFSLFPPFPFFPVVPFFPFPVFPFTLFPFSPSPFSFFTGAARNLFLLTD